MFTIEQEYYIRFILLLVQAGTDLLREITKKALGKKNETLHQFLNSTKSKIEEDKKLTKIQKATLYLSSPQFEDFDITLLSHLLINYLIYFIDKYEATAIKDIQAMRNRYYAHVTDAKMDAATFKGEWNKLTTIIKYVATGMNPDVQERHENLIEVIEKRTLDSQVLEEIRKSDQTGDFFENFRKILENIQRDVLDTKTEVMQLKAMLLHIKEQMKNQGRITKIVNTIHGNVHLSADNQETIDHAEAAIRQAFNNSIAKKEPTAMSQQAFQEKVEQVVKDFGDMNVEVGGVSKGSIIFEFKCQSLTAILDLIDYFYGQNFQKRLNDIAQALEHITGKKIYFTAVEIDRQSVKDVITKLQRKDHEKVVHFELSCAGVDGLLHALEVFEEGKAANSLNELSKALSDIVGKPVTLHTSIDLVQMKRAIQTIEDQFAAKNLQESSERLTESEPEDKELNLNTYRPPKNLCFEDEGALPTKLQDFSRFEDDDRKAFKYETSTELTNASYIKMYPRNLTEQLCSSAAHIQLHNVMSLVYLRKLNYKTNRCITSCALLSPDTLLLAYQASRVIEIVYIPTERVTIDKTLDGVPFDMTVLPNDQAALTLRYNDEILIIDTRNIESVDIIPVEHPLGITYLQGELYVLYIPFSRSNPCLTVLVLNLKGDHLRNVELDIRCPTAPIQGNFIVVSKDQQNMYITDPSKHALIRYSFQGERIDECQHKDMNMLSRPPMLNDGSLLICCKVPGTINIISADLKHRYTLIWNVRKAISIGFDPDNQLLYVGCSFDRNIIKVFRLERKK